jgi:hypothetical protein
MYCLPCGAGVAQWYSAGLTGWMIGGSSPDRGLGTFHHRVHTGFGVYPASYPMGTRGSGDKAAGA